MTTPGFTEIDLVAHCGSLGEGGFVHSLNLTNIHTTWVETAAVLGKSQVAVQTALEELRQALPFRLRGIDSDNGSEFINQHLWEYSQAQEIQFTRSTLQEGRQRSHRAEGLDPRLQALGLCPLRQTGGPGRDS